LTEVTVKFIMATVCSGQLSLLPLPCVVWQRDGNEQYFTWTREWRSSVADWGSAVSASCTGGNGWPHNALRYH